MMNNSITKISSKDLSVNRSGDNKGNGWQWFVSPGINPFNQVRYILEQVCLEPYCIW